MALAALKRPFAPVLGGFLAAATMLPLSSHAQELPMPLQPEAALPVADVAAPESPFGGPFLTRSRMTGDWLGARDTLAECGMTFDLYGTQFYQGVVRGGREQGWRYGGKLDYLFNLDGEKAGLWKGLFINLHGETRLGESVNQSDGLFAPSNIAMAFPKEGENISSLTGIKLTQMLSENVGVFMGKLNTLDEFPLRYSPHLALSRPGVGGFMNTALVFNPIVGRTIPYSAIAVGGAILQDGEPLFSITAFDPEERATIGFQDPYARGVVLTPDLILRTKFFDLPGVYNFGGTYSTASYRSVDPSAYLLIPGDAIPDPEEQGSWCVYANGYQAVWVDPCDAKRHWGFFAELGLSDGNPNPIRYTTVAGVTGRSMIASRPIDVFGVAFYYLGLSEQYKVTTSRLIPQRDEYGVELFYNYAITPWSRFSFDLQVARPSTQAFDTVIIPGFRLELVF